MDRGPFEIPDGVAYFNTASLAPQLRSVRAAGKAALERWAQPWTISSPDWFTEVEQLRERFARIVGADRDGIALVPASSYGLAVAARNLDANPGERVLVLDEEYPSGIYTWRAFVRRTGAELHSVRREAGQSWTEAILAAIDERTVVVSVPNVHWTNGARVDLGPVGELAREVGAAFVLDLSQSAGALPVDVAELRPDFLVAVGYKWLLGPYSLGYLYVDERHRGGEALEQSWLVRKGAENFARLVDYTDELMPGARRFDVGENSNFILNPMAKAALDQILDWSVPHIEASLAKITASIEQQATARGLTALPAAERGPHMIGIQVPEAGMDDVVAELKARDVHVAPRSNWLRVAPHLHTTDSDVERLLAALDAAL